MAWPDVLLGGEDTLGPDWVQVLIQVVVAADVIVVHLTAKGRPAST